MTKKYESTLFDHLRKNQSLKISKRLQIWTKVAKAVQAQHQRDIQHMDLKSNNVFINVEQDEVKELVVADFGIGEEGIVSHHCGTPGVGSPEQFITYASRESDIFSLGKLSVQIVFPWDTFWGIMGTPVDQSKIDKFRQTHNVFEKFHNLVSSMLEVGRDTE